MICCKQVNCEQIVNKKKVNLMKAHYRILQFDFRCDIFLIIAIWFSVQLIIIIFEEEDVQIESMKKQTNQIFVCLYQWCIIFSKQCRLLCAFCSVGCVGHFGIQSVKYFDVSSMSRFIFEAQGGISTLYPSSGIIWELDQPFRPLLHGYSLPILFFIIHLSF